MPDSDESDARLSFAARAAALYLVLGVGWFLGTDLLAGALSADASAPTWIRTWRGWGFLLLSSPFLFWIIRRETEARSRSERLFATMVDLLPDAMILRRHDDGRIIHANPAFREWTSLDAGEAPGSTLYSLDFEFRERERERYERSLEERGEVRDFTFHIHIDGEPRVHLVSSRIVDLGGTEAVLSIAKDITRREATRRQLERSERRYRQLFEQNVAGTFVTELDGTVVDCNDAFAKMLGYESSDQLRGTDVRKRYAPSEDRSEYVDRLREEGALAGNELRLTRRDGREIWTLENSFLLERDDRPPVNMGTLVEITDRKRLEARLDRLAHRDPLTGLANRRLLLEQTGRALAAADRREERVGLVFLDLSRFKRVNDTLGHQAGDEILRQVARRLEGAHRDADVTARLGGDEFAVLLSGLDGPDDAMRAARRLGASLEEPFSVRTRSVPLDASLGVAVYPDQAGDVDELLTHADQAMYRSAEGTIGMYEPVEGADGRRRTEQAESLRRALEEDGLAVRYQPIRRVDSGETAGAEALARWPRAGAGMVPAAEFLPLAERAGLAGDLDRWMLESVVEQLGRWTADGARPDWVALNLSASSLAEPDFADRVEAALDRCGVDASSLVFELGERGAVRDPAAAGRSLRSLRETGVRVALDDFGSGASSLSLLPDLPVDAVKLAPSLVDGIAASDRRARLVKGVCALARELGMRVVAKGVEEREQHEALRELGVAMAQGHWTGEPVEADRLIRARTANRGRDLDAAPP